MYVGNCKLCTVANCATPFASTLITSPAPFDISLIVVSELIFRTSIASPLAGASVKVKVVPETAYAVVGACTVPLILTITLAVVAVAFKVNATVELSPEKLCVVIVAVSSPTFTQPDPLYTSNAVFVELKRKSPAVGVDGRCAVVPTETFNAVVLFISIVPWPVVVNPMLAPALLVLKVVSVTVKFPIELPPPTPKGPIYLAPTM